MKNYIPKSKDDIESIDYLKKTLLSDVKNEDILLLLEWTQDMHWEVSHHIANYFTQYVNQIKPFLIKILDTNDDEWKFNVLTFIIKKFEGNIDEDLKQILIRISQSPTLGEKTESLDEVAALIIKKIEKIDFN